MSLDESTLDDFRSPPVEYDAAQNECQNCGNQVTPQFARVFGDNDDVVHNCIDCVPNAELDDGNGAVSNDEVSR